MLANAYFLAKFRFDTAENEPAKNLQNFANFPNFANPNPNRQVAAARPQRQGPVLQGEVQGGDVLRPRRGLPLGATGTTTADRPNFGNMLIVFGCMGTDLCK